jgi:hypothetical protein
LKKKIVGISQYAYFSRLDGHKKLTK